VLALGALALFPLASPWGPLALLVLAAANLAFFRNPGRVPPEGDHRVVSPADGRVVEVATVEDPDGYMGKAERVAIFLSIFDGHVQRAPLDARVRAVRRRGTRFLAAFNREASRLNVQTRLDLERGNGTRLAVVQITGLVARRVICYPLAGDVLVRGEPYGLICYGSRVEIYLPEGTPVRVRRGDRVRSGETVIGEISQ
jgi:phosphatidylserine decarboxylase